MNRLPQAPSHKGCACKGECCSQPVSRYGMKSNQMNLPPEDEYADITSFRKNFQSRVNQGYELDEQGWNSLYALRQKVCHLDSPELNKEQETPYHSCTCIPDFGNSPVLKKASEIIDYVPESEFLKKMKQQCDYLQNRQPNIFSVIDQFNQGPVSTQNFNAGLDSRPNMRQNAPLVKQCSCKAEKEAKRNGLDRIDMAYKSPAKYRPSTGGGSREQLKEKQCANEPKKVSQKKSEHISRSKAPVKCKRRRKHKSSSTEKCESVEQFEPTLKRPHENSCERCWRYASPSRSPVNKPDQRYNPNFRRAHSRADFEKGDGDLETPTDSCYKGVGVQFKDKKENVQPSQYHVKPPSPAPSPIPSPPTTPASRPKTPFMSPVSPVPKQDTTFASLYSTPKSPSFHLPSRPNYARAPSPIPQEDSTFASFPATPRPKSALCSQSSTPKPKTAFVGSPTTPTVPYGGGGGAVYRTPSPYGSFRQPGPNVCPRQPTHNVCPRQQEPAVCPRQQEPAVCPRQQEPVVCPRQSPPVVTPRQQEPVVCPRQTPPVVTPRQQEPVVCSRQTPPVVTPRQPSPGTPSPHSCERPLGRKLNFDEPCGMNSRENECNLTFTKQNPLHKLDRSFTPELSFEVLRDSDTIEDFFNQSDFREFFAQLTPEKNPNTSVGTACTSIKLNENSNAVSEKTTGRPGNPKGRDHKFLSPVPEVTENSIASSKVKATSRQGTAKKTPAKGRPQTAGPCPGSRASPAKSPGQCKKSCSPKRPASVSGKSTKGKSSSPKSQKSKGSSKSPKKSPAKAKSPSPKPKSPQLECPVASRPPSEKKERPTTTVLTLDDLTFPNFEESFIEQYVSPHPLIKDCDCPPRVPPNRNDPNVSLSHVFCCHCNWEEDLKNNPDRMANDHVSGNSKLMSCECKNTDDTSGEIERTLKCPYKSFDEMYALILEREREERERELERAKRELEEAKRGTENLKNMYESQPGPSGLCRKYFVYHMTKAKEGSGKGGDDVEVLVEELTQNSKDKDTRTRDITEKMRKIMEPPSDSLALRFQKGVPDSCRTPPSSRILYF